MRTRNNASQGRSVAYKWRALHTQLTFYTNRPCASTRCSTLRVASDNIRRKGVVEGGSRFVTDT